jgi:hypothetical protein
LFLFLLTPVLLSYLHLLEKLLLIFNFMLLINKLFPKMFFLTIQCQEDMKIFVKLKLLLSLYDFRDFSKFVYFLSLFDDFLILSHTKKYFLLVFQGFEFLDRLLHGLCATLL